MKLLAFADTHGSKKAMEQIKEKSKKVDMIVCAGDVSIFGQNLKEHLRFFEGLKKPFIIIPGNHESLEEMDEATSEFNNFILLHGTVMEVDDYIFMGYGGGGFSRSDKRFEHFVKTFKSRMAGKKAILVTHAPPYHTKLDHINGENAGNKSIREFIDKYNPILAISGHLHENSEKMEKIGKSLVINPGPFGKIIEV